MARKTIYSILKWLVVLAAFAYLAYKLITFDDYAGFLEQWRQNPPEQFWYLAGVFLLLPLNWMLESFKWMRITSHLQNLKFAEALKGVLAGITTGFITPNHIGDLLGRAAFLKAENRASGITLSLLNSLTQNMVIMLCGIPAAALLFSRKTAAEVNATGYLVCAALLLLAFILFYLMLPRFGKKMENTRYGMKAAKFIRCLSAYSASDLTKIMLLSFLRYAVFCTQFFLMLRFFDVELTLRQALPAIPTNYLLVTFTPSIAFSEAAVRSSYAVFVIGFFSPQTVNIALAGAAVWVVNWVIPLLAGLFVVLKRQGFRS